MCATRYLGMLAAMYNCAEASTFSTRSAFWPGGSLIIDDAILNGFAARFEMNRIKIAKAIDKFIYSFR